MRIAHIGDMHWGLGYPGPAPDSRFNDINTVMDWSADRIIEDCDLVLVAGDVFKDARVFLDRASVEIIAATDWLRKITSAGIPVVVISGTPSHDAIAAYHLLREMRIPGVTIITEPGMVETNGLSIACLPGMNRSSLVTQEEYKGLPPHAIHQIMTDKITQTCQDLREQCDGPAVLLAHLTYDMADKGFEDVLMQHEPVLTREAVDRFDLVCLGHIHRPQQNENVFYCGSPERLNFNDEKITPGFWVHEIITDLPYDNIESMFIETPAREFLTITAGKAEIGAFIDGGIDTWFDLESYPDGKIVRVQYSCSENLNKLLNRKTLERALYDAGAYFVAEIKADIERQDRARDKDVTESMGPIEALVRWAEQQNIGPGETAALQSMAASLLEEVSA